MRQAMKIALLHRSVTALAAVLLFAGCQGEPAAPPVAEKAAVDAGPVSEIELAIAELSPEDQIAAKAQGFCAYANDSPLGSMGAPYKLMINDQVVFLCCEGCESQALKKPEETLAKVAELKAKVLAEKKL